MSMIERLRATLDAGHDSAQLRFGLATALYREGQFAEAAEHAAVAVQQDPDYSAAWRLLGRAYADAGNLQAARDAFEHGIATAQRGADMQLVKEMQVFVRRLEKTTRND